MPPVSPSVLAARREGTRRSLLQAAEEQFKSYGYQGTSLADIAALAGIGRTTFYEYFTDKEDLLASLVEQRLPELTEEIVAGIPRDLPHAAQFAELTVRMLDFAANDHLGLILNREVPKLSPQAQERVAAAHAGLSRELARIYQSSVESGEFRSVATDVLGSFIQDLIMSAARVLMNAPEPKERLPEVADELVNFVTRGLASS